jgi:phosphate transport system substrate-binding protein
MKHSRIAAAFSAAMAAAFLMGACAPAATSGAPIVVTAPPVVVTSPPQVITQIVAGTSTTIEITSTPGPTAAPAATALPAGSITLNGAGATFPDPIYSEWRFAYQYVDPSVVINYQAIGSGGGQKAITDGTVDFAGSDSLLPSSAVTATPNLQMFPTVAGAIVAMYTIKEVTSGLILDGPSLAGIYLGKINMWNDPAIVALNPGLTLPAQKITAVHRSDGSGTTENFTKYLSDVSPDWVTAIGAPGHGNTVQWPVDKAGNGIGGKGNAGVAAAVQNTPYSIGYVELSYAVANAIPFADMINASGKKVTASHDSIVSAMADYGDAFTPNLTIDRITNGKGAGSWPISTYTYMIINMQQKADPTWGCTKIAKYLNWVNWFLSDAGAAARATKLGYATLPDTVKAKVVAKLATVQCDGKPVQSDMSK